MGLYVNNSGTLSPIAGTPLETLTGLQEQINKQGAKNMAPPPAKTTVVNGVTFTVNEDGSVTGNGTKTSSSVSTQLAGQNFIAYSSGLVKLTGGYSADFHVYPWDLTRATRPYADETKTTLAGANQYDSNGELIFYVEKGNSYTVVTRLLSASSIDNKTTYPMVRWAGDLDPTYEPYAMSNQQLSYWKVKKIEGPQMAAGEEQMWTLKDPDTSENILGSKKVIVTSIGGVSGYFSNNIEVTAGADGYYYCWSYCHKTTGGVPKPLLKVYYLEP